MSDCSSLLIGGENHGPQFKPTVFIHLNVPESRTAEPWIKEDKSNMFKGRQLRDAQSVPWVTRELPGLACSLSHNPAILEYFSCNSED